MYYLIIKKKTGELISEILVSVSWTQEQYNEYFNLALKGHKINEVEITVKT